MRVVVVFFLIGALAGPALGQAKRTAGVRVDAAKYQTLMRAGRKIEASWQAGVSLMEFRVLARDFAAELALFQGSASNQAERDFLTVVGAAATTISSASAAWNASLDIREQATTADISWLFGTGHLDWSDKKKYTIVINFGVDFVRAAALIYAGDATGGLTAYNNTRAAIADRTEMSRETAIVTSELKARADRAEAERRADEAAAQELTRGAPTIGRAPASGELEGFARQLSSVSPTERAAAAREAMKIGEQAGALSERLVALMRDPSWDVRVAACWALEAIGAPAHPFLDQIKAAANDKSLAIDSIGNKVVATIEAKAAWRARNPTKLAR